LNPYIWLEEKWYDLLDKVNKFVPIYKITDPLDKVIPSFLLFTLICIVFFLILLYFIGFTEKYTVTFSAVDAKTKSSLAGVKIFGELNNTPIDLITSSDGAAQTSLSNFYNTYEIIFGVFLGTKKQFLLSFTADKGGYLSFTSGPVYLEGGDLQTISLVKIEQPDNNKPVPPTTQYPNYTKITLIDSSTELPIIDYSATAYVRFNCVNKSVLTKVAYDNDDGEMDGVFRLNETNCHFQVTAAGADGYEEATQVPMQINPQNDETIIELTKIFIETKGRAKIYVTEKNSSPTKLLTGIQVNLVGAQGNTISTTFTDNSGTATFIGVNPGTYTITAVSLDNNYAPLNASASKTIAISAGQLSETSVELIKMIPEKARVVKLRFEDQTLGKKVEGVQVFLQEIVTVNGIKEAKPVGTCKNSCVSDSNGLVTIIGLTSDSNGLVASVYAEGYVSKIIQPPLLLSSDSPTIIPMIKSDNTNSGSAKVIVQTSPKNIALPNATAFLFLDSTDLGVNKISILQNGLKTDENGAAVFYSLLYGQKNKYYATATYESMTSAISTKKYITSPGNQIELSLNMGFAVSTIQIKVLDYLEQEISGIERANVVLREIDVNGNLSDTIIEKLSYDSSKKMFTSSLYESKRKFIAVIDLNGYATNFLDILGLVNGDNTFKANLYPSEVLDKNVNVFFNGLYNTSGDLIQGNKSVALKRDRNYYMRIDLVINADTNYSDLFGSVSLNDQAQIYSLPVESGFTTGLDLLEYGIYSSAPISNGAINDNNYFIQQNKVALGSTAGVHWRGNLRKGVYKFITRIMFTSKAHDGNYLVINFSGKEIDGNNSFEDDQNTSFIIDHVIVNPIEPKIYFTVGINDTNIPTEEYDFDRTTKRFTTEEDAQYLVYTGKAESLNNTLKISIYNNDRNSIKLTSIAAYSYVGVKSSFANTSNGSMSFEGATTNHYERSNLLVTIDKNALYISPTITFTQLQSNTPNYLVITATIDANNVSSKYYIFIETISDGAQITITGAKFLAGVTNQTFDGEAYALNGVDKINLSSVKIEVKKACTTTPTLASITPNPIYATINPTNQNYFTVTIPGTYEYQKDCLTLTAYPQNADYRNYIKTLYAGTGGTQDSSLSCVKSMFVGLSTNIAGEDFNQTTLNWGGDATLRVVNKCAVPMIIQLETGLIKEDTCDTTLAVGAECTTKIIGINKTFSSSKQFSDVLGVFPILIKAKKSGSLKKYALSNTLLVHLVNQAECFAISKDTFNLINPLQNKNFVIDNRCQYTGFEDYYIPKLALKLVGADLNTPVPKYNYIDFDYSINLTGGKYTISKIRVPRVAPVPPQFFYPDIAKSTLDGDYRHYTGFHYDFINYGGDSNRLFFKWIDQNNGKSVYGARIEGAIKVNYKNGTTQYVTPSISFDLNRPTMCLCNGEKGPSCTVSAHEYCLTGEEIEYVPENAENVQLLRGIEYILLPAGVIDSIDFNVMGNKDTTNLVLKLISWSYYTEEIITSVPVSGQTTTSIGTSSFRIYPLQGTTFILKNLLSQTLSPELAFTRTAFTSKINPFVDVNITSVRFGTRALSTDSVTAWIEGGYLKAMYVGENYAGYDDGNIEGTIIDNSIVTSEYGTITATDYIYNQNK
jgi:hypothetical protein